MALFVKGFGITHGISNNPIWSIRNTMRLAKVRQSIAATSVLRGHSVCARHEAVPTSPPIVLQLALLSRDARIVDIPGSSTRRKVSGMDDPARSEHRRFGSTSSSDEVWSRSISRTVVFVSVVAGGWAGSAAVGGCTCRGY
jgi:hypothetical protein